MIEINAQYRFLTTHDRTQRCEKALRDFFARHFYRLVHFP
jgi:hypothetical protein